MTNEISTAIDRNQLMAIIQEEAQRHGLDVSGDGKPTLHVHVPRRAQWWTKAPVVKLIVSLIGDQNTSVSYRLSSKEILYFIPICLLLVIGPVFGDVRPEKMYPAAGGALALIILIIVIFKQKQVLNDFAGKLTDTVTASSSSQN